MVISDNMPMLQAAAWTWRIEMKKGKKIALGLLAAVLVCAGGVCWWQWDNIKALGTSLSTSREDLSQRLEENTQKVTDAADKATSVPVRDLTEEERAALQDESLSREELIDRLIGKEADQQGQPPQEEPSQEPQQPPQEEPKEQPAPPAEEQEQPSEEPAAPPAQQEQPSQQPSEETVDPREEELARLIAEIYLMKTEYTDLLANMYNDCIEEWIALPESQRTTANKYKLGFAYMAQALEKEEECDARMKEIQEKIRSLLVELGRDTSLVEEIQAAYEEEKELKKAYYLGLHS